MRPTIVKFAGIRIMEVKLTGRLQQRVIIQPASVIIEDLYANHAYVYSPVWLVR